MKNFTKILLLLALFGATSCAVFEKKPELDSLESGAKLDLRKFFNGELEGFSILQDGNEKIIDTGSVKISARWGDSSRGTITQETTDSAGKKEVRTWLITMNDDGTFDAVGHDLAGNASGYQIGNAAEMDYVLLLMENGKKVKNKFHDRMYLADDRSMIMISKTYSGFSQVGQKITSLRKLVKSEKAVALKTESKSEAKPEAKSEVKVEPKSEPKSEAAKSTVKQAEFDKNDDAN